MSRGVVKDKAIGERPHGSVVQLHHGALLWVQYANGSWTCLGPEDRAIKETARRIGKTEEEVSAAFDGLLNWGKLERRSGNEANSR